MPATTRNKIRVEVDPKISTFEGRFGIYQTRISTKCREKNSKPIFPNGGGLMVMNLRSTQKNKNQTRKETW